VMWTLAILDRARHCHAVVLRAENIYFSCSSVPATGES